MTIYRSVLMLWLPILLALVGLISINKYNYFPATNIFESLFFGIALLVKWRFNKYLARAGYCVAIYLIYYFIRALLFNNAHYIDVVIATKIFIYLIVIILFVGRPIIKFKSVILLFMLVKFEAKWSSKLTAGLLVLILLTLALIFSSKLVKFTSLEEIDRYRFFILFIEDMSKRNILNWVFGTPPLTPLSTYTCSSLVYYEKLFGHGGDGKCYSVIFHSMIIRTIFDHGLIGLFFILFFLQKILFASGFYGKSSTIIIGILLVNGLSVSSFNSIYAIFPIALLALSKKVFDDRRI